MARKTDIRTIQTEKALEDAFLQLMHERGFEKVTVRAIIDRAGVNRSTFYDHYQDKYDLLDRVENRFFDEMRESTSEIPSSVISADGDSAAFERLVKTTSSHLLAYADLIALLLGEKGDRAFLAKLVGVIEELWRERGVSAQLCVPAHYAMAGAIGMAANVIVVWAREGFKETPEEIAALLVEMAGGLMERISGTDASDPQKKKRR
jgi:AcrR family transcriptional regulator